MKAGRPKGSKSKERPHLAAAVMTATELAAYLQIHKATVCRLAKTGVIPSFRLGATYRFNREDTDAWMRRRNQPQK
jgi:excisionase family DNA binding protein